MLAFFSPHSFICRQSIRMQLLAASMAVAAMGLFWLYLGQTIFFVGPSEWDDAFYAELATGDTQHWVARNRYVHVWSLKLFYLAIDSRRTAAGLYPNIVIVALSALGFIWGRKLAGIACGLLAAALIPIHLVFLKWITVPYVDPTLALWTTSALLTALLAAQAQTRRSELLWAWCSGVACYFTIESKETGLAVVPVLLVTLLATPHKRRVLVTTLTGFFSGWLVLRGVDAVFSSKNWLWWSSDWNHYFGSEPGLKPSKTSPLIERMQSNYVQQLTQRGHLPFTLLGLAGAAYGFRKNLAVRSLALWTFSTLVFSSMIACKSPGIFADERYIASFAPALVILSSYWVTHIWRESRKIKWSEFSIGAPLLIFATLPAIYALGVITFGQPTRSTIRAVFFIVTLSQVGLFMVPWLSSCRWLPRIAFVLLAALTTLNNVQEARAHIAVTRNHLEPWLRLTKLLDKGNINLARWRLPKRPYATYRVRFRLVSLSRRPSQEISVRNIRDLSERENNEWIFSLGENNPALQKLGWIRVISAATGRDGPWSVYRPPN
jgi:hypothetical protein